MFLTEFRPYLPPPSDVAAQNNALLLHLTLREQQVVLLFTHGLFNAEIGTRLHLSPRTVEKYVKFIKKNYYKQPGGISKVCYEKIIL